VKVKLRPFLKAFLLPLPSLSSISQLLGRSPRVEDKSAKMRPFVLTNLPPELRNQIYELVFQAEEFEIKFLKVRKPIQPEKVSRESLDGTGWDKHNPFMKDSAVEAAAKEEARWMEQETLTRWRFREPRRGLDRAASWSVMPIHLPEWKTFFERPKQNMKTYNRRLMLMSNIGQKETKHRAHRVKHVQSYAGLLLTCKQIHDEAAPILYSKSTFSLSSPKIASLFLERLPTVKWHITSLSLCHETFGEPEKSIDRDQKLRHDRYWRATCGRIVRSCTSLKHVTMLVNVLDRPLELLDLDKAGWYAPIKAFEKAKLETFDFTLNSEKWTSCVRSPSHHFSCKLQSTAGMVVQRVMNKPPEQAKTTPKILKAKKVLVLRWYVD